MNEMTFEMAISQLEEIISRMESGNAPLADALGDYENAVKLVRHCTELLENAEKKLTVLTQEDQESV